MGVATTRSCERLFAAMGLLESAPIIFEVVDDVPLGGVLCALPALLGFGLLRHTRSSFSLPNGFYPIETIFLVLAFLALARIGSLEAMRYEAPGEWGKILGLDRMPEVKTLREKIALLCGDAERAGQWSRSLSQEWMAGAPEAAGTLYIDGHVRVYHGQLTKLPRRYVSRERLCLRGTTDYWVNAMDGQPFFVVTKAVDPGLLEVLRQEIIPRLKAEVPHQPKPAELEANPRRHRFTLIFDREGYSPQFMAEMKEERIAVISYHKFPGPDWPAEEFARREVRLINGEVVKLDMAERGICLSNGLWVREVRHRDERGHQTSILASDYISLLDAVAVGMFARWCQENFFKYMQEHYSLDRLVEYGTEPLPETTRLVNPAWRQLEGQIRSQRGQLARDHGQFGALSWPEKPNAEEIEAYELKKGKLLQSIQTRKEELDKLLTSRTETPKHVLLKDLPEKDKFSQLSTAKKHFVDTIKLIAYRAETALVHLAREKLQREDDGRALVRQVLQSTVDLRPDPHEKTLTVRVHRLSTAAHDEALQHLCNELTATETQFPGTELRLVFELVGSVQFHSGPGL